MIDNPSGRRELFDAREAKWDFDRKLVDLAALNWHSAWCISLWGRNLLTMRHRTLYCFWVSLPGQGAFAMPGYRNGDDLFDARTREEIAARWVTHWAEVPRDSWYVIKSDAGKKNKLVSALKRLCRRWSR